jgi:hypothetical protein
MERALAKRMQVNSPATAGVFAAYLALARLNGLALVFGRGTGEVERATAGLGRQHEGVNLSMKPCPCHRTIHATVEADLHIVAGEPLTINNSGEGLGTRTTVWTSQESRWRLAMSDSWGRGLHNSSSREGSVTSTAWRHEWGDFAQKGDP